MRSTSQNGSVELRGHHKVVEQRVDVACYTKGNYIHVTSVVDVAFAKGRSMPYIQPFYADRTRVDR
jgi:hypothetical protein